MDIAHQGKGKHNVCKPEYPHEESKLEEPGDKTDKEKNAHTEIQKPSDNLHIHDRHTLLIYSGFAVKGDGTCGSRSRVCFPWPMNPPHGFSGPIFGIFTGPCRLVFRKILGTCRISTARWTKSTTTSGSCLTYMSPLPLIAKMRNELGVPDKITNRIEVIIRTDFIPAAYALAEVATGSVTLILLFSKMDPNLEGITIFAVVCSMLVGLLLPMQILIWSFNYLTTYLNEHDAGMEKGRTGSS